MTIARDTSFAARLRGFGPVGLIATLVIAAGNLLFIPLSGILVLVWAGLSNTPYEALGYRRARDWVHVVSIVVGGTAIGVGLALFLKSVVLPLVGAAPLNVHYHYLVGNPDALPGVLYAIVVGAGFGEETLFRGYLFERLGRLLGTGRFARVAIVVITAALFGLAHYHDQGLRGVEQATAAGLVYGGVYAITRSLWMPMVVHVTFDLTALVLIYNGWETLVAQWFF